jgi:hypothetical protein
MAAPCHGNACGDITIDYSGVSPNGCYIVTNRGSKRVKVRLGDHTVQYNFTLNPGESHKVTGFNNDCVQGWVGDNYADYA